MKRVTLPAILSLILAHAAAALASAPGDAQAGTAPGVGAAADPAPSGTGTAEPAPDEAMPMAGEGEPVNAESRAQERLFRQAIEDTESAGGAYAPGLSESLLDLGLALQSQGRHEEALALFKRGVHLSRINEGLYCTRQIPLLQAEIASHIALQDYAEADERQRYLYRVQTRGLRSGESLTSALLQQAKWEFEAYQLGLGAQDFGRLMNMWDLNRLALNDVIAREGENSPNLLPPLYGMLQAQYLIADYEPDEQSEAFSDDVQARQSLHRFTAYRAQSYDKGSAVITAIYEIGQENGPDKNLAAAESLVMLGDWRLWHGKREAAMEAYQDALAELAAIDDAQTHAQHLLGEPVALPDIEGLRPLPPAADPAEAQVLLEFGVDERGRVTGLERLDDNEAVDAQANRFMRELRKVRFRPRFDQGQPVETNKLVKAFNLQ